MEGLVAKQIEETFFLGEDGVIYEKTDDGSLVDDDTMEGVRMLCKPEGMNANELRENTLFLLDLLNEYANRELTEKDLEGVV